MGKKLQEFLTVLNGFRKFAIMAAVLVVGIIFRIVNLVNGAEFVDLIKFTAIAFFGTNGIEHMTKVIKEWLIVKNKKEL